MRGHKLHLDDLACKLSDELRQSNEFGTLEADVGTLNRIIDSLVSFSELGKKDLQVEPIDVHRMIQTIAHKHTQSSFQLIFDEQFPVIEADNESLIYIFTELIHNASRFNHSSKKRIEVGYLDSSEKEHVFYVRDNGMGIEQKHHEMVFKMFKQLQRTDEFARGQGTGLSFCKRHIERHGGRIWLESQPKIGTCIFFALPKIAKSKNKNLPPIQ